MVSIRLYLNTRYTAADGTCKMYLSITHKSRTAYLPLPIRIREEHWDSKGQKVVVRADRVGITNELLQFRCNAENIAVKLMREGSFVGKSVTQIKDIIAEALDPHDKTETRFVEYYTAFAARHENRRTREIYDSTLAVLRWYDHKIDRRTFEEIDRQWLEGFFLKLAERSPSVNARNIHMRNVRAAFNDAITNGVTFCYPFRRVKIHGEPTKKRSLSGEDLRELFGKTGLPKHKKKYLDIFKLTFLLIGVNTIDLVQARADSLYNGRFEYKRAKTKRAYSIKVEPEAQAIIDSYKGFRRLLNVAESCTDYRNFTGRMNRNLKEIREGLTTYYARHSWATIAANDLDIPKETIAAALGHGGNSVTDIYINYDQKKVDEANRRVLDWVLYGKN